MAASAALTGKLPNWTWQQSMIRIKDPEKSIAFYKDVLGMTLVDKYDFEQWKFSLYFMQSLPESAEYKLEPGSDAAHKYLWSTPGVTLELTHNWGTEKDDTKYHPGNEDKDGFGHLAFACDDVYAACDEMEAAGIKFKKKPDEGRMKVPVKKSRVTPCPGSGTDACQSEPCDTLSRLRHTVPAPAQ
eukprot:gene18966-22669_t